MKELVIRWGEVVTPESVRTADLYVENGQLYFAGGSQQDYQSAEVIDARGCYITAGLFDLQVNGSPQCNLWADPTADQFAQLCLLLLKAGVTAFMPTLITDDWQHLKKNVSFLESMGVTGAIPGSLPEKTGKFNPTEIIIKPGLHLEGPFLSPEKPGVHPRQYLRPITMAELAEITRPSVKIMTLAPELDKGDQAIDYLLKQGIVPSLGHSNATFNEAMQAFERGIPMVTHIFNAMPPIHQRRPGAALASLLAKEVYCGVICDGLHVDPSMIKMLVQMKGVDKVILVTDMASAGTTGGELVGSSITLNEAVRNIVKWGVATFPEAIKMATFNPAGAMHLDHILGQIKEGRRADLVIWDKQTLAIKHVIAGGCLVPLH